MKLSYDTIPVSVRLPCSDFEIIKTISENLGCTPSWYIRQALHSILVHVDVGSINENNGPDLND